MTKQKRGFAAMDPALRKILSSRGGKAVQASGRAYVWTTEQAREAGRKGGKAGRGSRKTRHRRSIDD